MRMDDVAQLVRLEVKQDADGYDVTTEHTKDVYVGEKSVNRSEFYTSAQAGIEVSTIFTMRCCDYAGEPMIRHNGRLYKIVRSYTQDGEWVELVCSDKAV